MTEDIDPDEAMDARVHSSVSPYILGDPSMDHPEVASTHTAVQSGQMIVQKDVDDSGGHPMMENSVICSTGEAMAESSDRYWDQVL